MTELGVWGSGTGGTPTSVEEPAPTSVEEPLNLNGFHGGRDRTRTCDLLRVKQELISH